MGSVSRGSSPASSRASPHKQCACHALPSTAPGRLNDLVSVFRLFRILRDVRPGVLHATFSKPDHGMVRFSGAHSIRISQTRNGPVVGAWMEAGAALVRLRNCCCAHRVPIVLRSSGRRGAAHVAATEGRRNSECDGVDFTHSSAKGSRQGLPGRGRRSLGNPDDALWWFRGRIFSQRLETLCEPEQ